MTQVAEPFIQVIYDIEVSRDLLARCRASGDSSQFHGTFRPGDPRLIFGLYAPGN